MSSGVWLSIFFYSKIGLQWADEWFFFLFLVTSPLSFFSFPLLFSLLYFFSFYFFPPSVFTFSLFFLYPPFNLSLTMQLIPRWIYLFIWPLFASSRATTVVKHTISRIFKPDHLQAPICLGLIWQKTEQVRELGKMSRQKNLVLA